MSNKYWRYPKNGNRQMVFYRLSPDHVFFAAQELADSTSEKDFIAFGWDKKWCTELYVKPNNEAFIAFLASIQKINQLGYELSGLLADWRKRNGEGYESDKQDFYNTYLAEKEWLEHTKFLCRDVFNTTKRQVYLEAVKWCEEYESKWHELNNPYSPEEMAKIDKEISQRLLKPLWQELAENEGRETPETIGEPPKRPSNAPKPFHEYLDHPNPQALAEGLKKEFSTEKGRDIRRLLELLREGGLIEWGNRRFKALHEAIEQYFDRDIGTYQGVNDFKEWKEYPEDNATIQKRIDKVLKGL